MGRESGGLGTSCVVVGDGSVVAVGGLVGRDVPPGALVFGVPARKMEDVGPDFDWSRLL